MVGVVGFGEGVFAEVRFWGMGKKEEVCRRKFVTKNVLEPRTSVIAKKKKQEKKIKMVMAKMCLA